MGRRGRPRKVEVDGTNVVVETETQVGVETIEKVDTIESMDEKPRKYFLGLHPDCPRGSIGIGTDSHHNGGKTFTFQKFTQPIVDDGHGNRHLGSKRPGDFDYMYDDEYEKVIENAKKKVVRWTHRKLQKADIMDSNKINKGLNRRTRDLGDIEPLTKYMYLIPADDPQVLQVREGVGTPKTIFDMLEGK